MAVTKQRTLAAFLLSCFFAAAVGCGGDDDGPEGQLSTPLSKCEALASAICNRVAECGRPIQGYFVSAADEQRFVDACEQANQAECPKVVSVGPSFSTCLSQVPRSSCVINASAQTGFTPDISVPSSCEDVLLAR
jgi:hypothetical protein